MSGKSEWKDTEPGWARELAKSMPASLFVCASRDVAVYLSEQGNSTYYSVLNRNGSAPQVKIGVEIPGSCSRPDVAVKKVSGVGGIEATLSTPYSRFPIAVLQADSRFAPRIVPEATSYLHTTK